MYSGESLLDGAVDLSFVALCNDYLNMCADNQDLLDKAREER